MARAGFNSLRIFQLWQMSQPPRGTPDFEVQKPAQEVRDGRDVADGTAAVMLSRLFGVPGSPGEVLQMQTLGGRKLSGLHKQEYSFGSLFFIS